MTMEANDNVVLDTNVLLDWLVFRNRGVTALAVAIESGHVRWLATTKMRDELGHMLAHSSLAHWSPDATGALAIFDRRAIICASPAASRLRCTDCDDQMFIDLAIAEHARWLITHDRALLKLARRATQHGVQVLTPAAWRDRPNAA